MTISETSSPAPKAADRAPFITIVIPAFNEAQRLPASLDRTVAFLGEQPYPGEIIVVDDGSSDGTAGVVRQRMDVVPANVRLRLLQHETNRGKGAAIRTGCLAAAGTYVFFIDADIATPPEESLKLLELLQGGAAVVIGSRIQPDGSDMRESQPPSRRRMGTMFTRLRKLLRVLPDIDDTQCPMKGFRREAAQSIFARQRLHGWIFDAEVLHIARMQGYGIVEVPVTWRHIEGSRLRVRPQQAFEVARDLLRLRFLHRPAAAPAPVR